MSEIDLAPHKNKTIHLIIYFRHTEDFVKGNQNLDFNYSHYYYDIIQPSVLLKSTISYGINTFLSYFIRKLNIYSKVCILCKIPVLTINNSLELSSLKVNIKYFKRIAL